nr:hypothetical protein NZ312_12505 [Clostridioides difficile]
MYSKNVPTCVFQVKVSESVIHKAIVTEKKAKGSISFIKNDD